MTKPIDQRLARVALVLLVLGISSALGGNGTRNLVDDPKKIPEKFRASAHEAR